MILDSLLWELKEAIFPKKSNRAEWGRLKDIRLFTADITKKFQLEHDDQPQTFDVMTAFEVLEHIKTEELNGLLDNIKAHSNEHTILILSVSTNDDIVNGVNLHQTIQPKPWWIKKFNELG